MSEPKVHIESDFSEEKEEVSLLKKIEGKLGEYEKFLLMEMRGDIPEEGNMKADFCTKRREQLENEYLSLVCETSDKEYQQWMFATLDRLVYGLLKQDRSPVDNEKLYSVFELYRRAQAERNSID